MSAALAIIFAATLPIAANAAGAAPRGKKIAATNCQKCHATGRAGLSANPKSPPFRTLAQRYPLKDLEEALGEGIMVGHEGPEMPVFQFRPDQIADLMSYLRTIQAKGR